GMDRPFALHEGLASVERQVERRAENPDFILVAGVDAHLAVIRRARVGVAHLDKGFALIFRAVNPALSKMLDQNIAEIGIPAIDTGGAAANVAVSGQAAGQPGPVRAAIERSVYAALGTSAVISEDGAAALVGGRVKNVGTFRVDRDVGHAGVIVDKKHFVP